MKNRNATHSERTESSDIGQFNNPITGSILILIIGLVLIGCFNAFNGNYISAFIIAGIGAVLWVLGLTEHSSDKPLEIGLLTFWGKPITIMGRYIVVRGKVILMPYPPFYLDSIKIVMDNEDFLFDGDDFIFLTQDNISMSIKISVTVTPNVDDLLDYIQAGAEMKKVFPQIREILYRETQTIVREMPSSDVQTKGKVIQDKLTACLLEGQSFGILIKKLQPLPSLPKEIRDKLMAIKGEEYDRRAEHAEYKTMWDAAKIMQREAAVQFIPNHTELTEKQLEERIKQLVMDGKIKTIPEFQETVKALRLVRDGKAIRIESSGNAGNIVLTDAQFNMGGKK